MAQYQVNFYGSSYYGETNAFSGTYETADILTEEPLKNTFNVNIKGLLPDANYKYTASEVNATGLWLDHITYIQSTDPGSKVTFTATCDRMLINYEKLVGSEEVAVKLTTTVPGQPSTETTYTLNASSNAPFLIKDIPYGRQVLEMTLTTGSFQFSSIDARVCSFTIETRARIGASGAYTPYTPLALTHTPASGDNYVITGTSPNYASNDRIQVRIWMASSDNNLSPVLDEVDTYAGDTNNRTEDGTYLAKMNMVNIAAGLGSTFAEITSITWTSTEPTGTKITVRSRSTNEAETLWTASSIPYKKGVQRLRLKEGSNQGYITTPLINPASINPNLRIDHWVSWDDISYLPPDESSIKVLYEFLDEGSNVIYRADQPKYRTDRNLILNAVGGKPFRIKITLTKRVDKSSPAVEKLSLISSLIYEERRITEKHGFSAVDNNNTGEQMILNMSTLVWNPPAEATVPTYFLEDQTQRSRDVLLYLESTNSLPPTISRPTYTTNKLDKIWARVFEDIKLRDGVATGVYKHYQYGGGAVVLSQPDEIALASSFAPVLDTTKEYRYFIELGWFNPELQKMADNTVNDHIAIYWKSQKTDVFRTQVIEKSSHNSIKKGLADKSSDSIVIEVAESSTWGEVDWVSEEKIYFGIVNTNNEQVDYIRKHVTPESGDSIEMKYKVLAGDTFVKIATKFQVEEADVRYVNNAEAGEPVVGSTIIIPARIILPQINPAVRIVGNPYKIDIIYNSVKQGNKIVPENRIIIGDIVIEEEEVTIVKEKVLRQTIGTKDLLGNAKVTSVIGMWDLATDPVLASVYIPTKDFIRDGNFIDWSPSAVDSIEPVAGANYYVTYKCMKPKTVTITMRCDYQEQSGIDRIWRSPEVKEFQGICSPRDPIDPGPIFKNDFRGPRDINDNLIGLPPASQWQGATNPDIDDLTYIIEDNDLWVKTWTEFDISINKNVVVGSLQDRVPKDNWFPTIRTGYYYIGQDEYYLFSEPITVEPGNEEIPRSANITYTTGKYGNAAMFEKGTTNLVRNSGFEITNTTSTIQKITF